MIRERPEEELQESILEARRPSRGDDKEQAERVEAAEAYLGEDEKHFVDYATDCIRTSVKATLDIRKAQKECYDIYLEKEPAFYKNKASWQSRIVIPKPYQTIQFGAAAVKKAFSADFLSVKDPLNKKSQEFWQAVLDVSLNEQNGNLPQVVMDTSIMALAVGMSMEVIPVFVPGVGLRYDLAEPWKIRRDPDAPPRDPQGGMYWIHQEWLDFFVLQAGETSGKYFDVARAKDTNDQQAAGEDPFMSKEAIEERKGQVWERSAYRTMILTSEFWGTILDKNGDVLLENGTYTIAGGRVIGKPKKPRYKRLRWPGVSYSALPDLLKFGGRGLLESVRSLWYSINTLMCLAEDNYKWIINPPTEINIDQLVDPEDVDQMPGKKYLTRDSVHGNQAVRTNNRRDPSNSVLANSQYLDQNFQRGTMVTDGVQGLPGYRKDITWRESSQNLNQAMGVFGQMGSNTESGTIQIIDATQDVIETFAGYDDYVRILGEGRIKESGIDVGPDPDDPEGQRQIVRNVPPLTGSFHVSGLTALMKEAESLAHLREIFVPLAGDPRFAPYLPPYAILKGIEKRVNVEDEGIVADEETAKAIQAAEEERMKKGEHIKDTFVRLEQRKAMAEIEEIYEKLLQGAKDLEIEQEKIRGEIQNRHKKETGKEA